MGSSHTRLLKLAARLGELGFLTDLKGYEFAIELDSVHLVSGTSITQRPIFVKEICTMSSTVPSAADTHFPTFTPFLRPPEGVKSNPENPESLAHLSTLTIGVCIPLLALFVLLRAYVRIHVRRTWIFEDCM
jgi:hypothetical protein